MEHKHCWHVVGRLKVAHGRFAPFDDRGPESGTPRSVLRCCYCGRNESAQSSEEVPASEILLMEGKEVPNDA